MTLEIDEVKKISEDVLARLRPVVRMKVLTRDAKNRTLAEDVRAEYSALEQFQDELILECINTVVDRL